ncbi:MAG: bacillithiol biosynthesis cysteine-adding enzyme BshC [Candidatus Zixiibacteriota bacterium]|nr:MAG: bacillithiol biosynthesis cysteine-adding enzyme BshC [candidate division Zixibacteria bacterium]
MISNLIQSSKNLGYSDIYLDFLAGSDPARSFFEACSLAAVADRLDSLSFDRNGAAAILTRQNRSYDAAPRTFETIERLKDPRAVCVFAGQQAGFLGGPLLTLYKAIAIVKSAEFYSVKLDRPVIPIFWIAGDDHDFQEANHTFLLDRQGQVVRVAYESEPDHEWPMARVKFTDKTELDRAKTQLRETLGETDFTPALYDLVDRAYTENDTLVTGFAKFMANLTGDLGLPLFNPGDAEAKRLAIPFFRQMIDVQSKLRSTIDQRNTQISGSGYHIQVEKKENAAHLFYDIDGRKPIMREGDSFTVGDLNLTREELMARVEQEPERFSPDVLTRPVLQTFLFPTAYQRGGPSEIAYFAQMNPIFGLFDLPAPFCSARPTLTLLEKRFEKLMADEDITLEELTGDIEQVVNKVLAGTFPGDLEDSFHRFRRHLRAHFEDFAETSLGFDPALKSFAEHTSGKIDFNLKAFEGKVFASHKKKSQELRDRVYRLSNAVCPDRVLQERMLNITYFVSRYGYDVVKFIYDNMDREEKAHQVLSLSEMK